MKNKCLYLATGPEIDDWNVVARAYDSAFVSISWFDTIIGMKRTNPDLKIYHDISPQFIWYNHVGDPFAGYEWWKETVNTSVHRRIQEALKYNLDLGCDWILRWPDGRPVLPQHNNCFMNWTETCPKGKWDWSEGLTAMEAALAAIKYVTSRSEWQENIEGMLLEMGGRCLYSACGDKIPGYTGGCSREDGGGWVTAATEPYWQDFAKRVREENPSIVFIINTGASPMWGDLRDMKVNGFKYENFLTQHGSAFREGDWWSYWDNPFVDGERKALGLYDMHIAGGAHECIVQTTPKQSWNATRKRQHYRISIGTALLVGAKIACDRTASLHGVTVAESPEYWEWTKYTSTKEFKRFNLPGGSIFTRLMWKGAFPYLLVVNPGPTFIFNGILPLDAQMISLASLISLMKWWRYV